MRKLKKGFTIVELVIVIAVIAVLTAVLVPTFISLSRKAKDTLDKNVVTNANIQLAAQESLEGKNRSMSEAVKDVDQIGFHISTVQTNNGNMIVWDQVNDRFVLLDKNGHVVLKDEKTTVPTDQNKLFYPIEKLADRGEFSFAIYAKLHYEGPTSFTSGTSFDAGETEDIAAITYDFDSDANVLVVTNSEDTVLTVDAPNADFEHVGLCGKIIIEAVEDDTFKDYGKVGYVEVKSGHYVADAGADIKAAYATSGSAKIDKQNGGQIENAYGGAASYTGDNSKGNVELDFNENKGDVEQTAMDALKEDVNPQPAAVHKLSEADLSAQAQGKCFRDGNGNYYSNFSSKWSIETDQDGSHYITILGYMGPQSIYLINDLYSDVDGDIAVIMGTLNIDLNGFSLYLQRGIAGFGSELALTNSGSGGSFTSSLDQTSVAELGYSGLILSETVSVGNNVTIQGIPNAPIFGNAESQTINLNGCRIATGFGGSVFEGACAPTVNATNTSFVLMNNSSLFSNGQASNRFYMNSGTITQYPGSSLVPKDGKTRVSGYISHDVLFDASTLVETKENLALIIAQNWEAGTSYNYAPTVFSISLDTNFGFGSLVEDAENNRYNIVFYSYECEIINGTQDDVGSFDVTLILRYNSVELARKDSVWTIYETN